MDATLSLVLLLWFQGLNYRILGILILMIQASWFWCWFVTSSYASELASYRSYGCEREELSSQIANI